MTFVRKVGPMSEDAAEHNISATISRACAGCPYPGCVSTQRDVCSPIRARLARLLAKACAVEREEGVKEGMRKSVRIQLVEEGGKLRADEPGIKCSCFLHGDYTGIECPECPECARQRRGGGI